MSAARRSFCCVERATTEKTASCWLDKVRSRGGAGHSRGVEKKVSAAARGQCLECADGTAKQHLRFSARLEAYLCRDRTKRADESTATRTRKQAAQTTRTPLIRQSIFSRCRRSRGSHLRVSESASTSTSTSRNKTVDSRPNSHAFIVREASVSSYFRVPQEETKLFRSERL